MIIRVCVIDPEPRNPMDDVLVFQVPENSRQHELLTELLHDAGLEFVAIQSTRKRREGKR